MTKVWALVAELNSSRVEGPFGETENVALIKSIEYKTGITMPYWNSVMD